MNQKEISKDFLNEAKIRLETAEDVLNKNAHAFCVRLSQEAVELSLKAALRLIGIDFPKWHDIGEVLFLEKSKFPNSFKNKIKKLTEISNLLAKYRELAMYGNAEGKKSPSMIFNKEIAEKALKDAKYCVQNVEELFSII